MIRAGTYTGLWAAAWVFTFVQGANCLEVEVLQENGDPAHRIDIAILGDGYRAEDQQKLTDDAAGFLKDLWAETPLSQYRGFFNVKLMHVVSNENGADNGSYGAERDTALGAYYGCYGVDRLICLGNASAMWQILSENMPEYDDVFIVVNDPKYGGAGGPYSVLSIHDQAPQIASHEYGHSLGALADEYSDPYPSYPECDGECPEPNAALNIDRATIKWSPWVLSSTPLPTPDEAAYDPVVGAFEGARYQLAGVYRPVRVCMMRRLGYDFCPVCAEALVRAIYDRTSVVDGVSPPGSVQLELGESVDLVVETPLPSPDTMEITWIVGDQAKKGVRTKTISASALGLGNHAVKVHVRDTTNLVRSDPEGRLTATHTWEIAVVPAGSDTDDTGADTGGGDTDTGASPDTGGDSGSASGSDLADKGTGAPLDTETSHGSVTDSQTDTAPDDTRLCEPGARRCAGLFEYEVCAGDGGSWGEGRYCDADQRCENGECVDLAEESAGHLGLAPPDGGDDCGCRFPGEPSARAKGALSLVWKLLRM